MIDSLLFLPDVDAAPPDAALAHARRDLALDVPAATEPDDAFDAQVVAALAATRDGHAHAAAGAWVEASAAFERSARIRDALVVAGVAGPVVAARAWSDVAVVCVVAGDLDGASTALARVRTAARAVGELPLDVHAAVVELEAAIDPTAAAPTPAPERPTIVPSTGAAEALVEPLAGGLLWLDTTDDAVEVLAIPGEDAEATPAVRTPAATSAATPRARIAAVDDAVALAHGAGAGRAPGGLASRLRRLLKR